MTVKSEAVMDVGGGRLDDDEEMLEKEQASVEKIKLLERRKRLAELERRERELEKDVAELSVTDKCGRSREKHWSSS